MATAAERLAGMAGWNAALWLLALLSTAVLGWALLGALLVCVRCYRPCWGDCGRDAAAVRDGRRAWALTLVFAGFVALGACRVWWVWVNPAVALPALAVWLEGFRAAGGLFLVWAFRD